MRRRAFITVFGGAAVWPVAGWAQQVERPVRIGLLPIGGPGNGRDLELVEAFRRGLREVGLVEGRHVIVDVAWVANEADFPQAVTDLVRRGAGILVPAGTSASTAAKAQTTTVPIVFVTVGDPIGVGLVQSLARPGGNVTGFSDVLLDLSSKYVEIAREISSPNVNTIDYVWYAGWANGMQRFEAT